MKKKVVFWRRDIPWYKNFHIAPITINGYLFFIGILFLVWAYQHDVAGYQEVYEDPCSYCNLEYACSVVGGIGWGMENGIVARQSVSGDSLVLNWTVNES